MKILVVSDTHGALIDSVVEPLKKEKNIDIMIHCGDKYRDASKLAKILNVKKVYNVPGNCDFDIKNKDYLLLKEIEEKRVIITHGHLHHVKDGLDLLKKYAEEKKADIVIFGHTHISYNKIENNILFFNPGSPILPQNGSSPSYGIITILNNKIKSEIFTYSHN